MNHITIVIRVRNPDNLDSTDREVIIIIDLDLQVTRIEVVVAVHTVLVHHDVQHRDRILVVDHVVFIIIMLKDLKDTTRVKKIYTIYQLHQIIIHILLLLDIQDHPFT